MTAEYVDRQTGEVISVHEWAETPAEVAIIGTDPAALDTASPEAAAVMVTQALVESRQWLAVAMRGTDPTPIAEFKAWAATIEEATRQKKLGREIELDAAEMVRRAERGIGVAIRKGQAAGEIRLPSRDLGKPPADGRPDEMSKADPRQFFGNSQEKTDSYVLSDTVTDEEFENVLTEAKAEGNLSRANVVRKVKGEKPKPAGRPELLRKTRHHDSNRIVEQTVIGLEGYVLAVDLIDFDALDRSQLAAWSGSLATSLQSLNRLSRRLKELDQA